MDDMTRQIVEFVGARDWRQFHNPKDVALSLVLEAGEVLEHFQWKSPEEIDKYIARNRSTIGDELIDVLCWVLLMSYYLKIDLSKSFKRKMAKNEAKYPADKAKGRHDKYTAYQKKDKK
jgi:NTP pyrophosphatase (non-canonical NTP hydrolase)